MTPEESSEIVSKFHGAVTSGHYLRWNLGELVGVREKLREALQALLQYPPQHKLCAETLAAINQRIEVKEAEAKNAEQTTRAENLRLKEEETAERRRKKQRREDRIWKAVAILVSAGLIGWCGKHMPEIANMLQTKTPERNSQPLKPTQSPTPLPVSTPAKSLSPKTEPEKTSTPKP